MQDREGRLKTKRKDEIDACAGAQIARKERDGTCCLVGQQESFEQEDARQDIGNGKAHAGTQGPLGAACPDEEGR